ncbi:MAG: hypothetical protein JRF07_01835 [Deltaproteobacteria bacterium]|jgi:hypothetical protein|nr:hypothetical protein [Deltaproteobacteria bacterium]
MIEYATSLQGALFPPMSEGMKRFISWMMDVPLHWHLIAALCVILFLKSLSSRKYQK